MTQKPVAKITHAGAATASNADMVFLSGVPHVVFEWERQPDGSEKPVHVIALFTVGLNPSTVTKEKSDTTVAKVEGVARLNGFDGFVMLNLYPVRSTDFNALPFDVDAKAFSENLNRIEALVAADQTSVIWAAWGDKIDARSYFVAAAQELFSRLQKYGTAWQHFGTLTNSGHPRHPSRLNYAWLFSELDAHCYVQTLGT